MQQSGLGVLQSGGGATAKTQLGTRRYIDGVVALRVADGARPARGGVGGRPDRQQRDHGALRRAPFLPYACRWVPIPDDDSAREADGEGRRATLRGRGAVSCQQQAGEAEAQQGNSPQAAVAGAVSSVPSGRTVP